MIKGPGVGGRVRAFLAGFGILRFAALVPVIGAIVGLGATVYGLGALVIAGWRASRGTTPPSSTSEPSAATAKAGETVPATAPATVPAAAPPDAPTEPVTVATPKTTPKAKPTVRRGGSAAPDQPASATPPSDKAAPPKKPAD
jgi:hypothetical protein